MSHKLFNIILILISVILFHSCFFPCSLVFMGTVIDDATELSLDSVLIKYYTAGDYSGEMITDSTGTFSVNGDTHSVFIGFNCKELRVEFSKTGYETHKESTRRRR